MRSLYLDIPEFTFRDPNRRIARCRLRVYTEEGKQPIVVASELASNPGMSITNAAGVLAWAVYTMLERPELGMYWIEHYGPFSYGDGIYCEPENWAHVSFTRGPMAFHNPVWYPLTREAVELMAAGICEEVSA